MSSRGQLLVGHGYETTLPLSSSALNITVNFSNYSYFHVFYKHIPTLRNLPEIRVTSKYLVPNSSAKIKDTV